MVVFLSISFFYTTMGFFDTITDMSSSTSNTSTKIIMDETVVISSDTSTEAVTNTVGEIFETTKDGVVFVSENDPATSKLAAEISFIQDASELSVASEVSSGNSEESSTTAMLEISDVPESSSAFEILDESQPTNTPETTGVLEISESGASEDHIQNESASQTSEISSISSVSEIAPTKTEATAAVEAPSMTSSATQIQESPPEEEDILDADSTIKRAIAELVANASKIQLRVDAALDQEAEFLAEKLKQEQAHKIAIAALTKAAREARNTANSIKLNGNRINELRKLLESQLV